MNVRRGEHGSVDIENGGFPQPKSVNRRADRPSGADRCRWPEWLANCRGDALTDDNGYHSPNLRKTVRQNGGVDPMATCNGSKAPNSHGDSYELDRRKIASVVERCRTSVPHGATP
jgi:hypothetical protein